MAVTYATFLDRFPEFTRVVRIKSSSQRPRIRWRNITKGIYNAINFLKLC